MTGWKNYGIKDLTEQAVSKMSRLYHVAHVSDARRIIEDRLIKPELVRDKSVLNQSRICVVWTSPNTWRDGSMYGNVSFTLPLSALDERRYYWVEAMTKYSPTALRILVSIDEVKNDKVTEFDPTELGNPLHRSDDGLWWRLDAYNYEIMFEEHFGLQECEQLDFFDHHDRFCNKNRGSSCDDAGREKHAAAARIVGLAISTEKPDELASLLKASPFEQTILGGLARIAIWLGNRRYPYQAPTREDRAALFRAAMNQYAYGHTEHAKAAIGGLGSKERALKILLRRVKLVFGDDIHMKLEHELE